MVQSLRKKSDSVYGGDFVILNLPNQEKEIYLLKFHSSRSGSPN